MKHLYLSFLFLIIGTISCAKILKNNHIARIIGGYEAPRDSWRSQVFIRQRFEIKHDFGKHGKQTLEGEFDCGGTLLNRKYILTAAHCRTTEVKVEEFGKNWTIKFEPHVSDFTVYAGAHNIEFVLNEGIDPPPGVRISRVKRMYLHPEYNPEANFDDIAILEITPEIEETEHIKYARLPSKEMPEVGEVGTIIGWGCTRVEGPKSNVLMETQLEVFKPEDCRVDYHLNPRREFCAGDNVGIRDSCEGDSGGGFYIIERKTKKQILVGIISGGVPDEASRLLGVYTRVSGFLDWIGGIIGH